MTPESMTPMMRQYQELKEQNEDCILFFRLGDFYEMFMDDAQLAAKELDLTLTTRDKKKAKEEQIPMCGVPYHSVDSYVGRLVSKGYKVAICEQTEDAGKSKGLVEREVTRVVTPGTVTESSMLDACRNNYMACIYGKDGKFGVSFCDISTGVFCTTSVEGDGAETRVLAEIGRFTPVEIMIGGEVPTEIRDILHEYLSCCIDECPEEMFSRDAAEKLLEEHFHSTLADLSLAGLGCVISACGALLRFLMDHQKNSLPHIQTILHYTNGDYLELDITARRNLELTETMRDKSKRGSLLGVLDRTCTAMGGRMLRSWVEKPLLDPDDIHDRQDAVEELVHNTVLREKLRQILRDVSDLERLMARIATASCNGRDLLNLAYGCDPLPEIRYLLWDCNSHLLRKLAGQIDIMRECCSIIKKTVVEDPPTSVREGGLIYRESDQELKRLRNLMDDSTGEIAAVEQYERSRTGIRNLKVGYNRVFGYYIEVPKSSRKQVPEDYIRKQTLTGGERYITPKLKELEATILTAKDQIIGLEYELFVRLRDQTALHARKVQKTAAAVAAADALCSLAAVAVAQNYCRPVVDNGPDIIIEDGRHPVVEQMLTDSLFVPNDTKLNGSGNQIAILTGPNMAGKSTYMRQVALIVIMAHMGSFVPAKYARVGVVDKVFTRVGASDDLSSGQSTFMVEMNEVAHILRHASVRSLLILDEIGRGTSTYDGMAIARAVLEYVANPRHLGAKTLFATHYHELTDMEEQFPSVKNYSVAVKKQGEKIIFLRKVIRGAADESFGVEVANLAGLPAGVITRARQLLRELEAGAAMSAPKGAGKGQKPKQEPQLSMEDMAALAVAEELEKLTVEAMTPIEAMNTLYRLKQMLNKYQER